VPWQPALKLGSLGRPRPCVHLPELRLQGSLTQGGGVEFVLERQFALHPLPGLAVGLDLGLSLRSPGLGLGLKPLLMLVVENGATGPRQHHGSRQRQPIPVLPIGVVIHTPHESALRAT
jgi:hypothetical protein